MQVENYHSIGKLRIVKIIKSGLFAVMFSKSGNLAPDRFKTKNEACEFARELSYFIK